MEDRFSWEYGEVSETGGDYAKGKGRGQRQFPAASRWTAAYDGATEIDRVEGTWRSTSAPPVQYTITYRGGRYRIDETHRGRYRIDATRTPPHLDLVPEVGTSTGRTSMFIFQIEGDTLRIAWRLPPNEATRPQAFDEKGVVIATYNRVK
jgi:uncharacterized protein (TIGR03067 family)